MRMLPIIRSGFGIFALFCGLFLSPCPLSGEGRDIAIVVRPDTPVDSLTLPQIRKLLLGEQQFWSSSLRVTLLLRAPMAVERDVVLRVIYHMNEAELKQYWISKMFRAEAASGPKTVYSNDVAMESLELVHEGLTLEV